MRNKLKLKTMDDRTFDDDRCLRASKRTKMFIKNAPNYEILSNPQYRQEFQFISLDQRKNDDFETSDLITRVLYLADHYQINDKNPNV